MKGERKMDGMSRQTLAWHETMGLHELVASQSIGLMKLKMGLRNIDDMRKNRNKQQKEGNINI